MNAIKPEVVWIMIGLALLLAEFAIPGLVVFFFGLGALAVGVLCYFQDISLNAQLIVFTLGSLVMLVALRHSMSRVFLGTSSHTSIDSTELDELVGQRATVVAPIHPDVDGRIEFHGSQWPAASSQPIAEGTPVEIVGRESLTIVVRPI